MTRIHTKIVPTQSQKQKDATEIKMIAQKCQHIECQLNSNTHQNNYIASLVERITNNFQLKEWGGGPLVLVVSLFPNLKKV